MNYWRKISADYWMCFKFDVYREYGVWKASFYVGPRFNRTFKSSLEAMAYCDRLEE